MAEKQSSTFTINGEVYSLSQLPSEGHQLLALITEAQNELSGLDVKRKLLQASQQHLFNLLKPLLPAPIRSATGSGLSVVGEASEVIPSTEAAQPEEQPFSFPENIPEIFKAH